MESTQQSDTLKMEVSTVKQEILDEVMNEEVNEFFTPNESVKQEMPNASGHNDPAESPTTGNVANELNSKCGFCCQQPTTSDEPKLLECLHTACSSCISKNFNQNQVDNAATSDYMSITCPICKIESSSVNIIDHHLALELDDSNASNANDSVAADVKCSSCSDNAMATSWCVDCNEFICDSCVQAHRRLKITKEHTIKSKDEYQDATSQSPNGFAAKTIFCPQHSNERLSLFCTICDCLTCRDCQLTEHREHKYKFVNEIAEDTRVTMNTLLKDVTYKKVLLTSAMTVIDDRQRLINEKKACLVKEITQMVCQLANAINTRGKQLVQRLNEVCDSKQKTLKEKKEALDQLSILTDHCVSFTQHVLEKSSDMTLLHSKRHIISHLNRIKCRRADIPNPEIPVRIHLALEKFPDLIKVVSSIGAIVVDGKVYPPATAPSPNIGAQPIAQSSPSPQMLSVSPQNHLQLNAPTPQQVLSQVFGPPPQRSQPQTATSIMSNQSNIMGSVPMNTMTNRPSQYPSRPLQMNRVGYPMTSPNDTGQMPMQQTRIRLMNNQIVTSSTHPQAGNMVDNLRGLLQPSVSGGGQAYGINNGPFANGNSTMTARHQTHNAATMHNQTPQQQTMPQQLRPSASHGNSYQQYGVQTIQQQISPQQRLKMLFPQNQHQQMMTNDPYYPQPPSYQQNRMMNMSNMRQAQAQQQRANFQQQLQQPYNQQMQMTHEQQGQWNNAGQKNWHTPVHPVSGYDNSLGNMQRPSQKMDDSFKIKLNSQRMDVSLKGGNAHTAVTSTIPKTPSPNTLQGKSEDPEKNFDKFCQDSVNDLMATIAKLDSNGVQVVAESNRSKDGSPNLVDSSTDNRNKNQTGDGSSLATQTQEKDDPNEDWCAVCMDGGELVCCDKCPKVFHQNCHIPCLSVEESDTWQCLLCMNFADYPDALVSSGEKRQAGNSAMTFKERKIAERIVLEVYCQYETSLHFREMVPNDITDYHDKIKKPIALDVIRKKLDWNSPDHYTEIIQLLGDLRLMFRNAYVYNERGSKVYEDAQKLEEFLDQQLEKWLPQFAYEDPLRDEDPEKLYPPLKRYRRIISE